MLKNLKQYRQVLVFLLLVFIIFRTWSSEIYIEQIGSGSTIDILQQGADNRIGSEIVSAYIGNGLNTVTIEQVGSSNQLDLTVNGSVSTVTAIAIGNDNIQQISCGSTISASCSGSTITNTIEGNSNNVQQMLGSGAFHAGDVNVIGDTNNVSHVSRSSGVTSAQIQVTGNQNSVGVEQSGMLDKIVVVNTVGDNNTVSIIQSD